eukprot:365606-Chlamydomonas_euryale.AAC.7
MPCRWARAALAQGGGVLGVLDFSDPSLVHPTVPRPVLPCPTLPCPALLWPPSPRPRPVLSSHQVEGRKSHTVPSSAPLLLPPAGARTVRACCSFDCGCAAPPPRIVRRRLTAAARSARPRARSASALPSRPVWLEHSFTAVQIWGRAGGNAALKGRLQACRIGAANDCSDAG